MNIAASLVIRNELARYLTPCIEHLLEFVDTVVVLDDASDDGTREWLLDRYDEFSDPKFIVACQPRTTFFQHEGHTRQALLELTLAQKPTHVLNLDADELLSDGPALRKLIEEQSNVKTWHIPIAEVWSATEERILERVDGGWRTGRTLCWKVPNGALSFPNRALACGRVPSQVRTVAARPAALSLLHFGWLDEKQRIARAARYAKHDGGRFHQSAHLQSILWPPEKIELRARSWPEALAPWKDAILEHANERSDNDADPHVHADV